MAGKKEIIDYVSSGSAITRSDAEKIIEKAFEAIQHFTDKGEKVTIRGFGTFEVKTRAARKGRNLQTKEIIDIAATQYLKFKEIKRRT